MKLTKDKSFDECIVIMGLRGTGKSAYALRRAVELQKDPGCYVVVHDAAYRLPDHYFDDEGEKHTVDVRRYTSTAEAARGLKERPGAVHVLVVPDGMEVARFASQVAEASLKSRTDGHLLPVVLVIDEGVAVKSASRYRMADDMLEYLVMLRHNNVGLILAVQDPRFVHYSFAGTSSEIVIFHLHDEAALKKVCDLGMPRELADQARTLPKYKYLTHRQIPDE
jgi:hypothetical protein